MKRIISCCLLLAGIFSFTQSYSQCTPDPACLPAQLICPAVLPNACEDEPYSESLTISLGTTISTFPLADITLDSITGLPPGYTFSCSPADCIFPANTNSCILISSVTGAPAGVYPLRGYLQVDVGFAVVPIDTPIGAIIIDLKDCNDVCNGTASIDACGICSGGNTGLLPNCDDGDPCTLDDCDGLGGCINTVNTCDDANACTEDECISGNCFNTPIVCDDNDVCNGIETCDIASGCVPGIPLPCDDGDACTGIETCDALLGCLPGNPLNCDDGDTCTIDFCDLGQCFNEPIPGCGNPCDTLVCEDFDNCTIDGCDNGQCVFTPVVCDDSNPCTNDACNILGRCDFVAIVCDDGDSCTTDFCDLGTCFFDPIPGCGATDPCDTLNCDDSDPCTLDACVSGACEYASNYPVLDLTFSTSPCEGEAVTVTNLSTGVDSGAVYLLDVNSNGTINLVIPASDLPTDSTLVLPVPPGVNGFTAYVVNSTGCSDTLVSSITVLEKPELDLTFSTSPCEGEAVTVTNLSTGVDSGAVYYLDVNSNGTINLIIPAADLPTDSTLVLPVPPGVNGFTVYVVNGNGCSDTLVSSITVLEKPELDLTFSTTPCEGDFVTVTNLSTGVDSGATYYLDVNSNGTINLVLPASGLPGDSTLVLPVPPGVNSFTVYVVNSNGCSDTLVSSILVLDKPELAFDYQNICEGDTTFITNLSTGVDSGAVYSLDLYSDGSIDLTLPASALPADSALFVPITGNIDFTVYVENGNGCADTLVASILVADCDDGDPCTIDSCSDAQCFNTPIVCDDQNLCTDDACVNGLCEFTALVCDDGDTCTTDFCDLGQCFNEPIPGCGSGDPCDTLVCDDADPCTIDACVNGQCEYTAVPCDDFDSCTNDTCVNGQCVFTPVVCDDQDACTNDACVSGQCEFTAVICDDLDACTDDACVNGLCEFTPLICNDNDSCTIDGCFNGICEFTPVNCDDNDSCTVDICQNGQCLNIPVDCTDGDPCTDDICQNGQCFNTPVDCSDNDACTDDLCISGSCFNQPIDCDDGNPCTTDFCDGTGVCQNTQIPNCCQSVADCDDVNACTEDVCNGGICLHISTCCDDNDLCTIDVCDPTDGSCQFIALYCDDGDACTTNGCDLGNCIFTPINCDDNDLCTADACVNGNCIHTPQNCDDGDPCTTDFCDSTGTCQNLPVLCDDVDPCTNDSCVQGTCVFIPVLCDDSDLCTVDKCVNGTCVFTVNDCDDFDICTDDYCINGTCFHDPIANCCIDSTQCDDGDACTDDICDNNQCVNNSVNTDVTITEHLLPSFCQGGGVILKATSASATGFEWSTGETTESIQVVAPGTYSVTATNAGGCPPVASYTVTFDATELLSSYVIVAQK